LPSHILDWKNWRAIHTAITPGILLVFLPSDIMREILRLPCVVVALFAMMFSISNAQAQDPKYSRMLEDLVDGKYERVLFRAIGYTEKESTKKDPEPYAYMARAYLKIHQSDDPELKESYAKALKESLKYCTKFIKKDKENEYVPDLLDFIEELRAEAIAAADTEMDAEKYTRAKSMYSYLSKLDKTDPSAYIMLGLANYYARSTRDAEQQWATASQLMGSMTGRIAASEETELYRDEPLTESMEALLKTGIIRTAEQLDADGQRARAVELLESGLPIFEGDRSFMVTYGQIVG
jgi:tetratricopeptide (TPR) repeat protein